MNLSALTKELLFPYQQSILLDPSRRIVVEKSRRIGGTYIFALKAIIECLQGNYDCWYSSADEDKSLEFLRYVKSWCGILNTILNKHYFDLSDATSQCVLLPNGKRITGLSSSAEKLRSTEGIIILDEFAIREDQEEVWAGAQGYVRRGKLYVLSTHRGVGTVFWRLTENYKAMGFSKHTITLAKALEQGYAVRFATHLKHLLPDINKLNEEFVNEIRASCFSEDVYKQEFCCQVMALQNLISLEEYNKVAISTAEFAIANTLEQSKIYKDLFVGIDLGLTRNYTVLYAIERYENPNSKSRYDQFDYKTVAIRSLQNVSIPEQLAILNGICSHKSISKILVDPGTIGRAIADALVANFPGIAEHYSFTAQRKATICEKLAGFIKQERISVPHDNETVKADFLAMRRKANKSGTGISYDGTTPDGGHCDHYIAAAMALEAAEPGTLEVGITGHIAVAGNIKGFSEAINQ